MPEGGWSVFFFSSFFPSIEGVEVDPISVERYLG